MIGDSPFYGREACKLSRKMSSINSIFHALQQQKLSSSDIVNEELSKIMALILWEYIGNWYSTFSNDRELYSEIGQALASLIQELERRIKRVDLIALITNDLPKILITHIRDYRTCCSKAGTAYAGMQTFEDLFYGLQPHVALKSSESEAVYLRKVSQVLVNTLLSDSDLQSESVRLLVRELLANNVLIQVVDNLSDPAYLNELILLGLAPDVLDMINGEFSPRSGESDMSDYSDASQLTDTDFDLPSVTLTEDIPGDDSTTDHRLNETTLFKVPVKKQKSFLKLKKRRDSSFAQGLNKITFGGLDKLNNGMERLKDLVNPNEKGLFALEKKKRKQSKSIDSATKRLPLKDLKRQSVPEFEYDGGSDQPLSELDEEAAANVAKFSSDEQLQSARHRHGVSNDRPAQEESSFKNATGSKEQELNLDGTEKSVKVRFAQETPEDSVDSLELPTPLTKSQLIIKKVRDAVNTVWDLHRETRKGPKRLGTIDTTLYERYRLEENFVLLFEEIFELYTDRTWTYIQLHFFVRPVLTRTMGHIINR